MNQPGGTTCRGELLLDNVFDPEVVVGRPFLRPFRFLEAWPSALRNLKVGVTFGGDFQAPLDVATNQDGEILRDNKHRAVVDRRRVMPLLGLDIEIPVLSFKHVDFVPYFDLNSIDVLGVGIHFGAFVTVRFDTKSEWRNRVEYRLSGMTSTRPVESLPMARSSALFWKAKQL